METNDSPEFAFTILHKLRFLNPTSALSIDSAIPSFRNLVTLTACSLIFIFSAFTSALDYPGLNASQADNGTNIPDFKNGSRVFLTNCKVVNCTLIDADDSNIPESQMRRKAKRRFIDTSHNTRVYPRNRWVIHVMSSNTWYLRAQDPATGRETLSILTNPINVPVDLSVGERVPL